MEFGIRKTESFGASSFGFAHNGRFALAKGLFGVAVETNTMEHVDRRWQNDVEQ